VRLWERAARRRGLRFGVTEHLGATFKWFGVNKGCDKAGPYAGVPYTGNDRGARDLYLPNRGEVLEGWYTDNPWWHRQWFRRMKDLVDQHKPDLFYSDGGVPFHRVRDGVRRPAPGLHLIAHLYNTSAARHRGENQAVYNQKDTDPKVYRVGVLDIERGMQSDIARDPWQTDTCVGGWFYNVRQRYKTPAHVIHMLVNIVAKNGNLLLNLTQRPDGTLDDECVHICRSMARWIRVNGEGIYGTRPWRVAGEGPASGQGGAFKEAELEWTSRDFRFTAKGDSVYAFQMEWPADRKARIRSLGAACRRKVKSVKLLGAGPRPAFKQTARGLDIRLPAKQVCNVAHCFRVELA
jgi:alpha-L-fucosidase